MEFDDRTKMDDPTDVSLNADLRTSNSDVVIDETEDSKTDEYIVEDVLDRRITNGNLEYLIKWYGWAQADSTWEPVQNLLNCQEKIENFEKKLVSAEFHHPPDSSASIEPNNTPLKMEPYVPSMDSVPSMNNDVGSSVNGDTSLPMTERVTDQSLEKAGDTNGDRKTRRKKCMLSFRIPEINGFDRGLVAEKIVGITTNGELMFIVQWVGLDRLELVPFNVARYRCPSVVIEFLQKHIRWCS